MKAAETSLEFLQGDETQFIIPFFQRAYVWKESNWERLLDSLNNSNSSHYLGSIIIKVLTTKNSNGFYTTHVIDGQQRITTLSILMRALMDTLNNTTVNNALSGMLFCRFDSTKKHSATVKGKDNSVVKLVPGYHDKDVYTLLIKNPSNAISQYPDNQLVACYNYFMESLKSRKKLANDIYKLLISKTVKFIVQITLEVNDNAQAIFDVSNGTGVSLTCADIIKNYIFLALPESSRLSVYQKTWEKVFDLKDEDYNYWTAVYNSRTNIENLLFAVAQMEKHGNKYIYDAQTDTYELLSEKYRLYFDGLKQTELECFINKLMKYAMIYRNYLTVEKDCQFCQDELIPRYMLSFSNLNACTVLFPYFLKLFDTNCDDKGTIICGQETNITSKLAIIERMLIRSSIVQNLAFADKKYKPTTKNFNKLVAKLVTSLNPEDLFTSEQLSTINDDAQITQGLCCIGNNAAKTILFLLNLKLVASLGTTTSVTSYAFNYELEHIMPQEFKTHWGLPSVDKNGNAFDPLDSPEDYRKSYVYYIGNMTIITPKANKTIKNYTITVKMTGDTTKSTKSGIRKGYQGYEMFATEPISSKFKTDIISSGYVWNEQMIDARTNELVKEVLATWA